MINNLYCIGSSALNNAQVAINNASANIANADTEGYQRTEVNYSTRYSITINGLSLGTGADVDSIEAQRDQFVEAQYLDSSADLSALNSAMEYLSQLDTLLDQDEDNGLGDVLSDFWTAWNDLAADPDSSSAREALLGSAESLVYELNNTAGQLDIMETTINTEIKSQVDDANELIDSIAKANAALAANPYDNQLISDRDQMIRDLNDIIGIKTIAQENNQVTILTEEGQTLVDGTQAQHLAYGSSRVTESLVRGSGYDGELEFSGSSSEELLIEFVSTGADGTAQFKVSLDGGETWETDESGNVALYTAGDQDDAVEIEGVEIWFENGTADHTAGDRYIVMPKSGLYLEGDDGSLTNITPLTDTSGQAVSGRIASGSLAGLYNARDDEVVPIADQIDSLAEAIVWETNSLHSQGAGLEHHSSLTGSYSVEDSTAALSNSGLHFADKLEAGSMEFVTYDADGNVSTTAIISIDPATDSLNSVVADINASFGGELTAAVDSDGRLVLSAASDMSFEVANDSTGFMAAMGCNTFFSGTDAETIAIDSDVVANSSYISAGSVGDDGLVSSASNDIATSIAGLSETSVNVDGTSTSLGEYLSDIVTDVGSAVSSLEAKQVYVQASAQFYYDQQASTSEVSLDEELTDLVKFQYEYQAAAEIISTARTMMDTLLGMI